MKSEGGTIFLKYPVSNLHLVGGEEENLAALIGKGNVHPRDWCSLALNFQLKDLCNV